ncbi:hypothetical protein ES703_76714 [subsurface metagenome]
MVPELLVEAIGDLERRVGGVIRQVAEKRPVFVVLDERHGVFGQIVNDVPLSSHDSPVVFEDWVEIISPVPGAESVVFVEAAGVRMVGILGAVVPFPKSCRSVPSRLERLANRFLVEVQSLRTGRHAVHAATRMVSPR